VQFWLHLRATRVQPRAELLELMRLWFVRAGPWLRARHQARSRWFHQRARLARNIEIALVS